MFKKKCKTFSGDLLKRPHLLVGVVLNGLIVVGSIIKKYQS